MVLLGVLYMYMVSTDYSSSSGRRKVKSINRRYKAEFLSELMQWNYNIKFLLIATCSQQPHFPSLQRGLVLFNWTKSDTMTRCEYTAPVGIDKFILILEAALIS